MNIADRISEIKATLPPHVTLVAVSKTQPNEAIMAAYEAGHRIFGENKVQELSAKAAELPTDILWHYIGHVQTNKIKFMAPFVHLVQGVDRIRVLSELNKEAAKNDRIIDCLLQVFIADEETKFGFSNQEVIDLFQKNIPANYPNVRIRGLMGMATFTENKTQVTAEFEQLKTLFDQLSSNDYVTPANFNILSIGMSGDYDLAIKNGSTMVRIGTAIFGERQYKK